MSARQPFIPQGRPPARSSPKTSGNDAQKQDSKTDSQPLALQAETPFPGIDKPLNLSSFAKRKNTQAENVRKASGDTISRSRSPQVPHAPKAQKPGHSPFFSSNSSMAAPAGFRMPPPPNGNPGSNGQDEPKLNGAHISTSLDDGDSIQAAHGNPASRFVSQNSVRSRVSSRSSLERINEEPPDGVNSPQIYGRDDVLAQGEGQELRGSTAPLSPTYTYEDEQGGMTHPPLRRVHKRLEQTEVEFSPTKRRRVTSQKDTFADQADDSFSTPPPPPPFTYPPLRTPSPPPYMRSDGVPQGGHGLSQDGQVLHKLLGLDLDVYVGAHQMQYEKARKKWAECSMEEWKAGADELTTKFGTLIDFVKEHMLSKLKLHTTLHSTLADHRAVLSKRDAALKNVRETLVRDGASVVAGRTTSLLPAEGKAAG